MTQQLAEFDVLVQRYEAAERFYKKTWQTAEKESDSGIFEARDAAFKLMLHPGTSVDLTTRKVAYILTNPELVEWLANEEELVRSLLASFMCLKGSDA